MSMSNQRKGMILTLFGGCCWGFSGVMGKLLFDVSGLTALWLVSARLLISGFLMLAVSYAMNGNHIFDVWKKKESIKMQLIFCLFGTAACQLCYFTAIETSNPATATVLQYLAPLLVLVYTYAQKRQMPAKLELLVLFVVLGGVFLLTTHGNPSTLSLSAKALFWGLAAALTYAIYTVQPRKLLEEYHTFDVVGWGMFLSGIIFCLGIRVWKVPGVWTAKTYLWMGGIIVFGTILSFSAYLYGVSLLGVVKGSLFACVEPLMSTILSVIILHQAFVKMDFLGIFFIIFGITALAFVKKK